MSGFGALANPAFRRYFVGAVAGVNGNWIFRVLLSWLAWDLTGSASFVGLVAALSLAPVAFTAPFFGALTDRTPILVAYRWVSIGLLACPAALLALMLAGVLTPSGLLGIALLFGTVISAYHPVRQSLGPRLVDQPQIGSVVALAALNFNVGRVISPAIGGFLIAQLGTIPTAAISTALFLPNLIIGPTLKPRAVPPKAERSSFLTDLAEGLRAAWSRLPVRYSLLLTVAAMGPIRGVTEILALIADGRFQRGAEGLGLLTSAVGAGALIAAVFQVVAGARLAGMAATRFTVIAVGFTATAALTLAPSFPLAFALAPIVGFAGTYVGVSLQIGIQTDLEDELRGRIMSLWMVSITLSTSALAFTISALSEVFGLGPTTLAVILLAGSTVALIAMIGKRRA
ncbi:MFS transporter [Marimonas arenosa]|uniref:MFS transporter n=1 Tax=Marimonas arenosa TaxID=1795305 RepID=A0AAE3WDA9_9RHOB|nr:MFS transporter [Marimonas arenosa]MDQ2090524.1 MFS transporter [Marimonas arenosa]